MGKPTNADGVPPEFAALIERYGAAMDEGRISDAAEASAAVMAAALEEATTNPTPELLRGLLIDQAENDGQWDVARRMYEEDLAEAEKIEDHAARAISQARAQLHIARIEYWQGNHCEAFDRAKQAVDWTRAADWPMPLACFLETFAGHALRAGFPAEAVRAADEGLSLLHDRRSTGQIQANLLLRKAEALWDLGEREQIHGILDIAWMLVEPMAEWRDASGIQTTIAKWSRLEAKLRSFEQRWPAARDAWQRSVDLYRQVAEQWGNVNRRCNAALAEVLTEFADAVAAAGDYERAEALREERSRIPL